jgi:transposase
VYPTAKPQNPLELEEIKRILLVGIRTLKKWIRTFIAQGADGLRQWGYAGQDCRLSDEQWAEVEEELGFIKE